MTKTEEPQTLVKYNGGYLDSYLEKQGKICISVDWLQIFGHSNKIPKDTISLQCVEFGNLIIQNTGNRSKQFTTVFDIHLEGQKVGTLEAFPNSQILVDSALMLKIENDILYTQDYIDILFEICETLNIKIQNISRLDIAIDGANQINDFLNDYNIQVLTHQKEIKMKGKAFINPKRLDYEEGKYKGFQIGSPKSAKFITVYNKSLEIEQASGKKYIEKYWWRSGFESVENVQRVEMRLKSDSIAQIEDFDLNKLVDTKYLASIFQTHCQNFFEFHLNDDSNSSRCTKIELIDYTKLCSQLLKKAEKPKTLSRYKVKMLIHHVYFAQYSGKVEKSIQKKSVEVAKELIRSYELDKWFEKQDVIWRKKYQKHFFYNLLMMYLQEDYQYYQKYREMSWAQYLEMIHNDDANGENYSNRWADRNYLSFSQWLDSEGIEQRYDFEKFKQMLVKIINEAQNLN